MDKTIKSAFLKVGKTLGFNVDALEEGTTKKEFGLVILEDGTEYYFPGEEFLPGVPVLVEEGGDPVEDGEYTLPDGSVFVVVDGILAEVLPAMPEGEEEAPEMAPEEELEAPSSTPTGTKETVITEISYDAIAEATFAVLKPLKEEFEGLSKENATLKAELKAVQARLSAYDKAPADTHIEGKKIDVNKIRKPRFNKFRPAMTSNVKVG